jgi:polysaccharide export outer membrane protein
VITAELSEYVVAPDVTVSVTQMNSNVASVMGGVSRAGMVELRRDTRVLEAIARMGGFNNFAKRKKVRIMRPTGDGFIEYIFNYDAFLAGKAPGTNMVLKAGDTVVVPE